PVDPRHLHSFPTRRSSDLFFIANYFFSFLIIGLAAGVISLINKPKPLRADVVAEALFSYYLLFTIGVNNLVNFVFHVFVGDTAADRKSTRLNSSHEWTSYA